MYHIGKIVNNPSKTDECPSNIYKMNVRIRINLTVSENDLKVLVDDLSDVSTQIYALFSGCEIAQFQVSMFRFPKSSFGEHKVTKQISHTDLESNRSMCDIVATKKLRDFAPTEAKCRPTQVLGWTMIRF